MSNWTGVANEGTGEHVSLSVVCVLVRMSSLSEEVGHLEVSQLAHLSLIFTQQQYLGLVLSFALFQTVVLHHAVSLLRRLMPMWTCLHTYLFAVTFTLVSPLPPPLIPLTGKPLFAHILDCLLTGSCRLIPCWCNIFWWLSVKPVNF